LLDSVRMSRPDVDHNDQRKARLEEVIISSVA
jgi:hypothetical protein